MKLSKEQVKNHKKAQEILLKDVLTFDEKLFVLENWHEGAENMNSFAGAFFTPTGLARDFAIELNDNDGSSLVDLCAGIGMLAFYAYHYRRIENITCIEVNPMYYEAGKKILPEANWILDSVLNQVCISSLPKFDQCISNPPFGNIKTTANHTKDWLRYTGSDFEFKVIEIASKIADRGIFILPQMSTPYKYSGQKTMCANDSAKHNKFAAQTGLKFEFNCGIDTSYYINDWNGVSPMCEIIIVEFNEQKYGKR